MCVSDLFNAYASYEQGKLAKYQGKMEAVGSILAGAEKAAAFAGGGAG